MVVDVFDCTGKTPLHYCAILNNMGMATMLLDYGASVEALDRFHQTPLLSALHLTADDESMDVAELLIAKGALLDAADSMRRTPLHLAA